MRRISIAFIYGCVGAAALAQSFTPISNLNQPTSGYYTVIGGNYEEAVLFTTGPSATSLASISISLGGIIMDQHGNPPGPFDLTLQADAGGQPGSTVVAMVNSSSNNLPFTAGVYSYVPASPVMLQANSSYWIVADSISSPPGAGYSLNGTPLASLDAGSTWGGGSCEYYTNPGWAADIGFHVLFSVTVVNTNLPSLAIDQPIVLTYTNLGLPYVLQQNSNLATTNWVTVTNATLSGVLGNQMVFILPRNAPRLFYRLYLP